jgi:two-component system cell cycle sensor histidine kinase/response regulator CckA
VVTALSRVLIAEDEPQLLRVLVRVLEKRGYAVVSAADGKTAIDVLRKTPSEIDSIVLDAAIGPDGAGAVLDVLAAEQPQIRMILTSGAELSDSLRSRLRANDGFFLLKPFPPSALVEAVERSLANGSG